MIRLEETKMKKWIAVFCSVFVLYLLTPFAIGQQAEIRILHVNDFHGFHSEFEFGVRDLMIKPLCAMLHALCVY
jgi:hypothetical protein